VPRKLETFVGWVGSSKVVQGGQEVADDLAGCVTWTLLNPMQFVTRLEAGQRPYPSVR